MKSGISGRRTFLKQAALAGSLAGQGAEAAKARDSTARSPRGSVQYPRTFTGRQLAMLAFPLGGVGAGSISLGGRGQLRDWEVFNRSDKGNVPAQAFASIWAQAESGKPVARVLEARLQPPYEGQRGLGSASAPGLPRLQSCTFTGEFPIAKIAFRDRDLPVKVELEAFSPFVPLNADDSGLPVAILRYRVTNPGREKTTVSIAWSLDNPVGREGRTNQLRGTSPFQGLFMTNPFLAKNDPLAGNFALCIMDAAGAAVSYLRGWRSGSRWRVGPLQFWDDFSSRGDLGPDAPVKDAVGSLCVKREIAAQSQADYTFLLAWHFPNRTPERCGWQAPKGEERSVIGNFYSTRFADAWSAAEYTAANLTALERDTRQFVAAIRHSTVPAAVREGAMANLSTLVTPTCFRTADGDFHGFEGSNDRGGCCFGNCTHVWNYEVASNQLYPALSRSLREASFGYCTDEQGKMDIRQLLPKGIQHFEYAAADGQMGQIMQLYLDWKLSGDTVWLASLWPGAKRAMEFAWIPGGWDANRDGVMEGVQHNTYDVEFIGPNPLCGVWYLGALRASEEMARAVKDEAFAAACRTLFERGSKWIDSNLFNGEYYIQKIQGMPKDQVAAGLTSGMGAANTESPDFQAGEGCLIDQLLGQYFAHIAGLGQLLDRTHVRKALESIYKYNYKRDLYSFESVQRVFALNDEAALVICEYPHGKRPQVPFPYFAEVMTGFEYAAAALMIYEGMVAQGIELVENVRRRYDGERRNPWNEAECGHHYARAMASWTPFVALSGFQYDARTKHLIAAPRINRTNFRSFWSCGSGWGSFSQVHNERRAEFTLAIQSGAVSCTSVELALPLKFVATVSARKDDAELRVSVASENQNIVLRFRSVVELKAGQTLRLSLTPAKS